MDQKEFDRDMQVYEIAGLMSGLSSEFSMMGFSLSEDNLQLLADKLDRWQTMLALIRSKLEEILNDD